jgi:hypothetical protein
MQLPSNAEVDLEVDLYAQPFAGHMSGDNINQQVTNTLLQPRTTPDHLADDTAFGGQFQTKIGAQYELTAGLLDVNLPARIGTSALHSTPYESIHGGINFDSPQGTPPHGTMPPPTTTSRHRLPTRDSGYGTRSMNHETYSYQDQRSIHSLYPDEAFPGVASIPDSATEMSDETMSQQTGQDQNTRSVSIGQQRCSWVDCGKVFPNSSSLKYSAPPRLT